MHFSRFLSFALLDLALSQRNRRIRTTTTTRTAAGTTTRTAIPPSSPSPISTGFAFLDQPCGSANGNKLAYPGTGDKKITGLCCSSNGYAGYTSDHCGSGCQTGFGRCGVDQPKPPIYMGCKNPNHFALTFDDGPSPITPSLLDYLRKTGVKATFFVNGNNHNPQTDPLLPRTSIYSETGKSTISRIVQEGHQLCSHTWSHQSLLGVNDYNLTYEMTRLNHAFSTLLGKVPTCMRPPYGEIGDVSSRILQAMGYSPSSNNGNAGIIVWNMDPVDYNLPIHGSNVPDQITNEFKEYQLQTADPSQNQGLPTMQDSFSALQIGSPTTIALMHDTMINTADFRSDGLVLKYPNTVPLTQKAVEFLKAKGYNLVRIDECLGMPFNSMYRAPNGDDDNCGDKGSYGGGNCNL